MNKNYRCFVVIAVITLSTIIQMGMTYAQNQDKERYNVAIWNHDVVGEWQFNAIAKEFNIEINYLHYFDFENIINAISSGKADFATDVTYTKERSELMYISTPTNIEYTYLFSKNRPFRDVHVVAVPENTVFYRKMHTHRPNIKTIDYHSSEEAISLFNNKKVDGILGTLDHLQPMLESGLDAQLLNSYISVLPVSIASSKTIPKETTDKFVKFLHTEKMQRELKQYLEDYRLNIIKQYLKKEVVKIGIDIQKPVLVKLENRGLFFGYTNESQKKGIAFDVIMQSCLLLGLTCQVINSPNETWENMYQDLVDKKIDVLGSMIPSKKREENMYFTNAFYEIELVMLKRDGYKVDVFNNISELITENIGVIEGDYYKGYIKRILPNKKLIVYHSSDQIIQGLINKEVDYIAMSRIGFYEKISSSAKYLPIQIDESIGTFHRSPLSFGLSKNPRGRKLTNLLNQALHDIDIQKIHQNHSPKPDWKVILSVEHKVKKIVITVLICVVIIVTIVIWYLRKQATTDPLTNLKNRRYLYFKHGSGLKPRHTLVYLDIDKFKQLNDCYGHEIGDAALICLAKNIKKYWYGQAYRMGGDEFVMISNSTPDMLEKRLKSITALNIFNNRKQFIPINISYGIFYNHSKKVELDLAIQFADKEMYKAKAQ